MLTQKRRAVARTISFVLLLAVVFAGLFTHKIISAKHPKINKELFNGTLLDKPRAINDFHLQGTDNQEFSNVSLLGNWTMMFFGFTSCGYVCPTTMAELGKTYRLLESKNSRVLPRVVMITLDPERDSLERLGQYVRAFDKHFSGARAEGSGLHSLTRDLGVAYTKVVRSGAQANSRDDIEHTGAIMLFNPQGKLVAFFTGPHAADKIADDFMLLTK